MTARQMIGLIAFVVGGLAAFASMRFIVLEQYAVAVALLVSGLVVLWAGGRFSG